MQGKLEGELVKIVKVENGWNVVVFDPEMPKAVLPGQSPCSQQPVRFWKTYIFPDYEDVCVFVRTFLEAVQG